MKASNIKCPDCQSPMLLRPKGIGGKPWYACSKRDLTGCKGAHGAHPDGRPKGFPGNAATRQARVDAHAAFDRLWKSGQMTRHEAYRHLQTVMGMTKKQAHIGKFTEGECRTLIARLEATL